MTEHRIAVLVPSRGRPASVPRLAAAICETAAQPDRVDLFVRLDDDDPTRDQYDGSAYAYDGGPRVKLAAAWNEQAEFLTQDRLGWGITHLCLWGDDNIPMTQGWDQAFLDRLDRDGPGFVYGRDGVWDNTYDQQVPGHLVLPTACMMPVELYRAMGYIAPPGLIHLNIDLAWRDLGLAAGCLFYEPGVTIRHLHRISGAPDDQTYRDANDDIGQKRADNNAFTAWKLGKEFKACVERIKRLRGEL